MAQLETLHLEHLPPNHTINIALYQNVSNAAFLHEQLLAGNTSFEYALIDASVIVSKVHALAAVYRAVNDLLGGKLRSRNVHSEIVFSLSPNNNIAESFRRFGITSTTTSLLVIKVLIPSPTTSDPPTTTLTTQEIQSHLTNSIQGDPLPFTDESISSLTDLPRVKKIYKLNSSTGGGGKKKQVNGEVNDNALKGDDEERKEIEVGVLGAMALRGSLN